MKFLADSMLGRLAKWLRILGYDTFYDGHLSTEKLIKLSFDEGRIFLTRNRKGIENIPEQDFFIIQSENYREQVRKVVNHFQLDTHGGLFSRCTICNVEVQRIDKERIKDQIPVTAYQIFNEFFQCPGCKRVYWRGSHTENTLARLEKILGERE